MSTRLSSRLMKVKRPPQRVDLLQEALGASRGHLCLARRRLAELETGWHQPVIDCDANRPLILQVTPSKVTVFPTASSSALRQPFPIR